MSEQFKSPWQHHMDAGHHEVEGAISSYSPNGVDVFEECRECQLCWLLPNVLNRSQYPITIHKYPMEAHGGK